ncbi:MAG TPA: ATP-binding protein [Mycobacteriales bacterium]|nr:ATP-binding protein [Mycobacteriales bacterium]
MIRPSTLRGKLAVFASITAAVWIGVLTAGFNALLSDQLYAHADEILRTRATAEAALVGVRPDGRLALREPPNDEALDADIWVYQGARAVERPIARLVVQREADRLATRPGGGFAQTHDNPMTRLYALPVRIGHRHVATVVAAADLDPYARATAVALWGSAAFVVLLLAGVYVVTRMVVARALRPVDEMTNRAAHWSAHDVEHRFGEAPRPAELDALANTLDELLARQSAVLRHEQQLSAELSHELRTPLSSILAETELLARSTRSESETRRAHAVIADGAARMTRIIDTLLSEARARTGQVPGRCEVFPVIDAAVRGLVQREDGPVVVVSRSPGEGPVAGLGAEVVERIVTPLLDNALRYASAVVSVSAAQRTGAVEVVIRNDGPGVPAGWEEAIFEPGRRADPRDGHDGAGLGLSLALRLARAGGGDIRLAPSDEGVTFVLSLPPG